MTQRSKTNIYNNNNKTRRNCEGESVLDGWCGRYVPRHQEKTARIQENRSLVHYCAQKTAQVMPKTANHLCKIAETGACTFRYVCETETRVHSCTSIL